MIEGGLGKLKCGVNYKAVYMARRVIEMRIVELMLVTGSPLR